MGDAAEPRPQSKRSRQREFRKKLGPLKQRPKLSDILHTFEPKHSLDEICASLGAEDRLHELARFRDHLVAGHGIFGGAAHSFYMLA